jgi:two-component system, NarL family, sensor histidine kinase UhpB
MNAPISPMQRDAAEARSRPPGHVPLFWRLFIPNAAVLLGACIVLVIEPANGRIVALVGGLAVMLTVNLVLMRRSFTPLARLTTLMKEIDPLNPGRRLPVIGPRSEVTDLTSAFNEMLDRLETERRESAYKALVAEEEERRRVALELHDEIGQQLTAQVLQLDRMARNPPTSEELETATAAAKQTLEDVRQLARRLRPEVLDTLGLVPALRNLCDRIAESAALVVRRSLPSELPPMQDDAELVVYRVAQESLTNTARHARATEGDVRLAVHDRELQLTVADDGIGIAPETAVGSAGGLRWMRERALLIGGRLEVGSRVGGGAQITLHVPIIVEDPAPDLDGRSTGVEGDGRRPSRQGSMSPRRTA